MRNLNELKQLRIEHPLGGFGDETCGMFIVKPPSGYALRALATCGRGWERQ